MGNKTSKKTIPLKEEIGKNDKIKEIQNPQVSTKDSSKTGSKENSLQENEKENNIISDIERKIAKDKDKGKDEVSQFEPISKQTIKNKLINKNKNLQNNNNNNQIYLMKNNMQNEYIIDINKYHRKINGKRMKIPKKLKNFISTSKYTWYNFVPKILYEQFSKMSNIYFIIIAILQCFTEISNADGKPIILMPLCIVVLINSIKDFYEDWKRKRSDDEENNRKVEVYDLDQKQFVIKKWKDIFVGNIVKIKKDEYFPADCVLISSSDRKTHNCFIESKNLDGETSLKIKKSINNLVERCKDLSTFQGKLTTQLPNEYIYQFDAFFDFDPQINNDNNNSNYSPTDSIMGMNDSNINPKSQKGLIGEQNNKNNTD